VFGKQINKPLETKEQDVCDLFLDMWNGKEIFAKKKMVTAFTTLTQHFCL
jgi:hypothetical protein